MFGDGEAEPSKDHAVLLCWEACKVGLPLVLAHKLTLLDFETRKDAAQVNMVDTSPPSGLQMFLLQQQQKNLPVCCGCCFLLQIQTVAHALQLDDCADA